jgi:hypothetical protein
MSYLTTSPDERGDNAYVEGTLNKTADGSILNEAQIAYDNWARYQYARMRGHTDYIKQAQKCERYYIGYQEGICDGHWDPETRKFLEDARRPVLEINLAQPIVETKTGQQIQSRVDISYQPRWGAATQEVADVLTQLVNQLCYDNHVHYLETEVFRDGHIEQRGYTDIRMDFSDNIMGDVRETLLDPRDVIPDPDANSYDPADWKDIILTKFMSIDEIEQFYGKEAATKVENFNYLDQSFGIDDRENDQESRNTFGNQKARWYDAYIGNEKISKRVRVIDRQYKIYTLTTFFLNSSTGDLREIPDSLTPEAIQLKCQQEGLSVYRKMSYRIRWRVTTRDLVLHDEWSPYRSFTVNPFFPYFRRGKTKGTIDNLISPSDLIDKAMSSELHILNSTANSGWTVEENSLVNHDPEDLEDIGATTGLVLVHKKGTSAPVKIQPNVIPTGLERMSANGKEILKEVGGCPDALQGAAGPESSGVAIDHKQFGAQLQEQGPLQNLARTREFRARKYLELVQQFYTTERVILVTKQDDTGQTSKVPLSINKWTPTGEMINNLTLGEYDVVADSVPTSATFENGQFQQAMNMRKEGIAIPDNVVIMSSTLAKKAEIVKQMQPDPAIADRQARAQEAAIKLQEADARLKDATATDQSVTAIYSGVQAAQVIAMMPTVSALADKLLLSAGFKDQDAAPIVPQEVGGIDGTSLTGIKGTPFQPAVQHNTSPAFPTRPMSAGSGAAAGIETPAADGVRV